MDRYLLGLDLGTTGCKAMLFDEKGTIMGSRYIEYGLIFVPEGVEQNAEDWWTNLCECVKGTVADAGIDPAAVAALSLSSQGISGVPVDKELRPLYNSLNWLDNRSVAEQAEMKEKLGLSVIRALTGKNKCDYSLPELVWLLRNRSDELAAIDKYLMPLDFLNARMTGRAVTDLSMASGTLAFDMNRAEWIDSFFEAMEVPKDLFAELGAMGAPVGFLTEEAAAQLGLTPATLVALGAQDQRCASLGAGIEKGCVTVSLGTAAALCSLLDAPVLDPEARVTCCAMDGTHWVLESTIGTAGAALKWFRNCFFPGVKYAELDQMALAAGPCPQGIFFLPGLGDGKGSFFGLGLDAKPGSLARAVLEGIAFLLRRHVADHERLLGTEVKELRVFGGGASDVWLQIIADVTRKKVIRPRTNETACLGAAMLAAKGAGLLEDLYDAPELVGAPSAVFTPNPATEAVYAEGAERFSALCGFVDTM